MPAFGESARTFYPGLVPVEAAIWREWLRAYQQEWDRFEYNVLVGAGAPLPAARGTGNPELDAALQEAWKKSTQRKIDCLGWRGGDVTIFEVKRSATMAALGQLLVYDDLLPRTFPSLRNVDLAIVCTRLVEDLAGAYEANGIALYVLDPAAVPGL